MKGTGEPYHTMQNTPGHTLGVPSATTPLAHAFHLVVARPRPGSLFTIQALTNRLSTLYKKGSL